MISKIIQQQKHLNSTKQKHCCRDRKSKSYTFTSSIISLTNPSTSGPSSAPVLLYTHMWHNIILSSRITACQNFKGFLSLFTFLKLHEKCALREPVLLSGCTINKTTKEFKPNEKEMIIKVGKIPLTTS